MVIEESKEEEGEKRPKRQKKDSMSLKLEEINEKIAELSKEQRIREKVLHAPDNMSQTESVSSFNSEDPLHQMVGMRHIQDPQSARHRMDLDSEDGSILKLMRKPMGMPGN